MTDFLTRSWRPVTMYVFLGLIVADQLGLTKPVPTYLWDIIQLSMGAYYIGRSGEKIAKERWGQGILTQGQQP